MTPRGPYTKEMLDHYYEFKDRRYLAEDFKAADALRTYYMNWFLKAKKQDDLTWQAMQAIGNIFTKLN